MKQTTQADIQGQAGEPDRATLPSGRDGAGPSFSVKLGGETYPLATIALVLMLAGILMPAVIYSVNLRNPTPAELLVAISIALFSAVVFLWILDSTGLLMLRAEWMSKSIYAAAIASVLGTSVAVYRDAFNVRRFPYEGAWEASVTFGDLTLLRTALLTHSASSNAYWGFTTGPTGALDADPEAGLRWVEIRRFAPDESVLLISMHLGGGTRHLEPTLRVVKEDQLIEASDSISSVTLRLVRSN